MKMFKSISLDILNSFLFTLPPTNIHGDHRLPFIAQVQVWVQDHLLLHISMLGLVHPTLDYSH